MEIYPIANHATLPDMPSATNTDHDGRYPLRTEWLQNGFPNRTDSTISWADAVDGGTLTIDTTNGSFDYFINGVKYTKSSTETIQITDTEGLWTFYYVGDVLTSQLNPTDAQLETIMLSAAWIAFVYWDATNNIGTLLEERHGLSMSPYTHLELHFTAGTTFFDGLALGDFVISDGADNEDAQFSIATGQIFDEDIKYITNAINKTTGVEVWYRSNSNWRKDTQTGFKVLTQDGTSSTRLSYDNAGTRTEVTDNKFVLYHVFAWNAVDLNPIAIMGQAEYGTAKAARIGATTEINSLLLGALPSKEMKAIATVIFQTKDTYTNDVNARVVQTDEGDNYVDWRLATVSPSAAAGDHGLLSGLTDDDHIQYLLIDGTRAMTGDLDMGSQDIVSIDQIAIDLASAKAQLEFGTAVPVISALNTLYQGYNCYYDGDWKRLRADNNAIMSSWGSDEVYTIWVAVNAGGADSAIVWDARLTLDDSGNLAIDGTIDAGSTITGSTISDGVFAATGGNFASVGTIGCGTITATANSDILLSGTGHVTSGSEGFIVGTLTITDGSIDDTDGSIAFGATNFTGVGTIGCGDITCDGDLIIDNTSTEAFLVRQNSDARDVFCVNTTNDRVKVGAGTALLDFGLQVVYDIGTPRQTANFYYALSTPLSLQPTVAAKDMYGYFSQIFLEGAVDTGNVIGMYGNAFIHGTFYTGTLTNAMGGKFEANCGTGSPDVTNVYGVYIGGVLGGDNSWALYSATDILSYFVGAISVKDITDRTSAFAGKPKDALDGILAIRKDAEGEIDHNTLPEFARGMAMEQVPTGEKEIVTDIMGFEEEVDITEAVEIPTRSLSAMITLLVEAIKEQQNQIDKLKAA